MASDGGAAPRVSVVVPVRNEAGNVAALVAEIEASLTAWQPFEIIYVNDGSTDQTSAVARAISHSRRAAPSGRSRARKWSSRAPTRWVTSRLNPRTCAISVDVIL